MFKTNARLVQKSRRREEKKHSPPLDRDISPLLWWGGGEAQKTLPSFSLPPSIALALELQRLAWVFFFFFATKMQNTSLDLHALGAFLRPERACPCKERWYKCTAPAAVGKTGNSAIALQRILRSTYMMGQGWQLKAPNLDQCEPLRENVLPAWSAGDAGKCSPGGEAANSSQLIYLLCVASVQ